MIPRALRILYPSAPIGPSPVPVVEQSAEGAGSLVASSAVFAAAMPQPSGSTPAAGHPARPAAGTEHERLTAGTADLWRQLAALVMP